ncbi:uncharacterized protein ACNS7B_018822 isoform 2-T2 [Menidia menidia]
MSDDSSSEEEWCLPTGKVSETKCWECGKPFGNLRNLMKHYKSHNINATCHICKSFSNVLELNKHAESHCKNSVLFESNSSLKNRRQKNGSFSKEVSPQQSTASFHHDSASDLKLHKGIGMELERPGRSVSSMDYVLSEDDDDMETESSSSSSSEGTASNLSSTDTSDSSSTSDSEDSPTTHPSINSEMCEKCGRGPFRSLKLHLLHCTDLKTKYKCVLCNKNFFSEAALQEHQMPLNSCNICFQVFANENSYYSHKCPRGFKLPLTLFCPESMPKPCSICKSFFTSDTTLSVHVNNVHSSVVNTKVCIITKSFGVTNTKAMTVIPGAEVNSTTSPPVVVQQAINGKLLVDQNSVASQPFIVNSSSPSGSEIPPTPTTSVSSSTSVKQPSSHPSECSSVSPAASDPGASAPTILALFENISPYVALMKRLNTKWRSKAPCPCRQCGAILRQPSLIISHRYRHRGHRPHRCQCGRAFKHRLHLLRHCMQHAEATSYICVGCGDTFTGAEVLAQHLKGMSRKRSRSGRIIKVKKKCRKPFTCDCGQQFFRPSAYIWHQLKNRAKQMNRRRFL